MANFEMQKSGGQSSGSASASQNFLDIADIRQDVIVTRDGGLRAVIAVSSTNFVLKSQDEQQAIIARYQGFLNSLEFPIQILLQSRHLDIHGYLDKIRAKQMEQPNELLRMQMEEYVVYITKLLEFGNIMNKTFYAIVPYSSGDTIKTGLMQKLKKLINPTEDIVYSKQNFQAGIGLLEERVAKLQSEISGLSLRTMRLNTQELVELVFNSYNMASAQKGHMDVGELDLTK